MLAAGMLVAWAGYALSSWGYILVKGYNICLREWVSPLHPYSGHWPPGNIPTDSLFPSCGGAPSLTAGPMQTGGTGGGRGPRKDLQTPDATV